MGYWAVSGRLRDTRRRATHRSSNQVRITSQQRVIKLGSDYIPATGNPLGAPPILGAQASMPACLGQSAIAGSLQAWMPALPGWAALPGIIKLGSDYIPATEVKAVIFYFVSRGSTALNISVFHSETEFLISALNFAPLSRGSASTIFSCWAALTRYDSPGRRSFIKKKANSGATTRSRQSTRYSLPDISQSLRWNARSF